jgi:sugar O-acyltransferase (sialic acid O-acetyltransferase NeuD family)
MNELVIIGSGGHASSLLDLMRRSKLVVKGYVSEKKAVDGNFFDLPWFGDDENFTSNEDPKEIKIVNAVGFMGGHNLRKQITEYYASLNFKFQTLIDSTSLISETASIGEGAQILANSYIGPSVVIGTNSIINTGSIIEHDSKIGSNSHVAPGVTICGDSYIGADSFVGAGSVIIQSIRVLDDVIIGAGSIVIHDLESHSTVVGNPARILEVNN